MNLATASRGRASRGWLSTITWIALTVVAMFAIRTFIASPFVIPSASMQGTLDIGDRVVATRIIEPSRGDVVVFDPPAVWGHADGAWIKRVVATEGDHLVVDDVGRVAINGVRQSEPYAIFGSGGMPTVDLVVPEGTVFLMGDNRANSNDSRFHQQFDSGLVPVDAIYGVAKVTFWPPSRIGGL